MATPMTIALQLSPPSLSRYCCVASSVTPERAKRCFLQGKKLRCKNSSQAMSGGAKRNVDATQSPTPRHLETTELSEDDAWESSLAMLSRPYVSRLVQDMDDASLASFFQHLDESGGDPLWEQIKLEALYALEREPQAGPQLYTCILSQPSLLHSIVSIIANEIETELMPAIAIHNLFLEMLDTTEERRTIDLDLMAAALRSPSVGTAMNAILFNKGLHALVCHRVGHRLWLANRTGLAYFLQSTVSNKYCADLHPAAQFGAGIYLKCGAGVVVGETAVVGDDVSILQGVTLGGTGKERGDRHPKIRRGVILQDSASVLGNIEVGEGAVITAKSIVTKSVPPLARVSGVPAKVRSYREISDEGQMMGEEEEWDGMWTGSGASSDLERKLRFKYMQQWNLQS